MKPVPFQPARKLPEPKWLRKKRRAFVWRLVYSIIAFALIAAGIIINHL